jgi:DNA-damage-inducible protein J
MATVPIQLRVDEKLKEDASKIFEELGMDLSTAIRIFLVRSVKEKGIPFSMKLEDEAIAKSALASLQESNIIAQNLGISEMTLDEINAEIADERKKNREKSFDISADSLIL